MRDDFMEGKIFGKKSFKNSFLISVFAWFAVFCLLSISTTSAYHIESETMHEINNNYNSQIKYVQQKSSKISNEEILKEFEITFNYRIQDIIRDGRLYSEVILCDGGVECGMFGEERPFFQHSIILAGGLEYLTVEFVEPVQVFASAMPYLVPQIIGINDQVVSSLWKGELTKDVMVDWSLNYLSKTTLDNKFGNLYSLKLYPVEYTTDGIANLFTKAKITYLETVSHMWYTSQDPGHKPTGAIKYLIITHPDLAEAVKPFAEWKSQKGLITQITTTEEIKQMYSDGDDHDDLASKMRSHVQKMEAKFDLNYLLLIGDWDKVPTRNTKNSYAQPMMGEPDDFASDLYFACVDPKTTWNKDGDLEFGEENEMDDCIPDMANGRLAINSPTVLSEVLNNLIEREKNPSWDSTSHKTVYMCGDPGYMPGDPMEVMDHFWTTYGKDVFSGRETIYYDGSGTLNYTSNSVKEVLDNNHQAMCYFGHGQPTGLPELFDNNQIGLLENSGIDGSLFAMACLTGFFDDPANGKNMGAVENCFAEMLTETVDKGLVGYIGSSRMAVGYIDTTYSDDAPGLEEDYWRAIRTAAQGNLTPTIGEVWRTAITRFASSFSPFRSQGMDNPGLRTFLEYNLLGDPDAPLFFNPPETLHLEFKVASDNSNVWTKVTNSSGGGVENAMVSIYKSGELGRTANTNSTGIASITIPPNNGGIITITASRACDKPVNDTFSLPDNLAPQPQYTIDPEIPDGNNDYYISKPTIKLYGDEPVDVEYRMDESKVIYRKSEATLVVPDGLHTIYFRVVDSARQWSEWTSVEIQVDLTPPELEIETDPKEPNGEAGWFITKTVISLKSNEEINSSTIKVDNDNEMEYKSPIQLGEGIHQVTFIATDLAGNMNITTKTLKVDLTPPASEVNVSHKPDGTNGYYLTTPMIQLSCPNEQGARVEYKWDNRNWQSYGKPITAIEGLHTLYYRGVDVAGNMENENNLVLNVDTEAPELCLSVTPEVPDGENGNYISHPEVEISTEDSASLYYQLIESNEKPDWSSNAKQLHGPLSIPDGAWTLYVKVLDLAGNEGYMEPASFKVDTVSPSVSWEITPNLPNGENGWYNSEPIVSPIFDSSDATVVYSMDDLSELAPYDGKISIPNGVHRIKFKAMDSAGNAYYNETDWIKIDINKPLLTIKEPVADTLHGSTVRVIWFGSDETSEINRYKIKMDNKPWEEVGLDTTKEINKLYHGEHELLIIAYDSAGNYARIKRRFNVDAMAPYIVSGLPKGDSVKVDSKIIIRFSEEMNKDTVRVHIDSVKGILTWEDNTVIYTPNQNLKFSTKYNIKVTGVDLFNNSIEAKSWSFETIAESEDTEAGLMPIDMISAIVLSNIITASLIGMVILIYKRKRSKP